MSEKIAANCVECGNEVPYQGRGRPRQRHAKCMTPKQKRERNYMKSYMPKYYKRGDNMKKHMERMKKRRAKEDE